MKRLILLLSITIIFVSCSSDNEPSIQNTTSLVFTEVMSFQVDTLELDMASSSIENSFYITYSADNGFNENVLKYNLTTLTQSNLTHPDITESRQIEVVNNEIYSYSSNDIYKFDLNLGNLQNANTSYSDWGEYSRVTNYNNDLLVITGMYYGISRFSTLTDNFISSLPPPSFEPRFQSDGEIYNDKLYIFGGSTCETHDDFINQQCDGYNEINIYDLLNDSWNTETIPFQIHESFTDLYLDNIIIAGNKNPNQTNSFIAEFNPMTNAFTDISSNLDLTNISIRGITIVSNEIFVAYVDLVSPMPNIMTIRVVKASLN